MEEGVGGMATINGSGIIGLGPIGGSGARPGRSTAGFSVPTAAGGGKAAAAAGASSVDLAGLLALQSENPDEVQEREARRHGHNLLAELAALQRALLADDAEQGVPLDQLQRLERLAAAQPATADPQLREVLEAITLRARVELARFET